MKFVTLALALTFVTAAAAGPPSELFTGDIATVDGTKIACTSKGDDIRCANAAGLAATLSKPGAVRVSKGAKVLLSRAPAGATGKRLRVGVNSGFAVPNAPIYCHVYVQGQLRTITCSEDEPAGVPNTYGFDMTDRSVVVFRYGSAHERHGVARLAR